MKTNRINRENNEKCILFFNGWGMDENAVKDLVFNDFDVCMFYDYRNIDYCDDEFVNYKSIYVVAWSLGVWVASRFLINSKLKIDKTIAINGTEKPVHNEFGILPEVFQRTLETWNEINRKKFYQRIFGSRKNLENSLLKLPERTSENQKKELISLREKIKTSGKSYLNWSCALIGSNDLIFSKLNQTKYWENKTRMIIKELPHFPFNEFKFWKQIIDL